MSGTATYHDLPWRKKRAKKFGYGIGYGVGSGAKTGAGVVLGA